MVMKPKLNYKADAHKASAIDSCETPPFALAPLVRHLWKKQGVTVWEPACGSGILANALRVTGLTVTASDIVLGQDFFTTPVPDCDLIVTNPPYGIKYKWLERCYELGKPFALLMPLETLGAAGAIKFAKKYGMEVMILYPRVSFKMPKAGWFSSAQFPTAWFCHNILPEKLMFAQVYPPERTASRLVCKVSKYDGTEKLVPQSGFADWIEDPSYYDWPTQRFVYEVIK